MIMSFSALSRNVFTLDGPVSCSLEWSGPCVASVCVPNLGCGGGEENHLSTEWKYVLFVIWRASVDYFPVHN